MGFQIGRFSFQIDLQHIKDAEVLKLNGFDKFKLDGEFFY